MNDILYDIDECVNTLISDIFEGNNDCRAIRMDEYQVLIGKKDFDVNACTCSSSCGSNYSRNGDCGCSSSCGSNYSR